MRSPLLPLIALTVVLATPIAAQIPPTPGVAIASWQEVVAQSSHSGTSHLVWARNDTTVPMIVTGVRFSDCQNINRGCDSTQHLWRLLKPSAKVVLAAVRPDVADRPFDAIEHVEWRTPPLCESGGRPSARDMPSGPTLPPQPAQMILPPFSNRTPQDGTSSHITFFVSVSGMPDSVTMTNIADPKYATELRRALMKYVFNPGERNGCPISGETSVEMTFGKRRPR